MAKNQTGFLHQCLHNPFDWKAQIFNGLISLLIVVSVAIVPLFFLPDEQFGIIKSWLATTEKIVVSVFVIEFLLRLLTAKSPFRFIFSWEGLVDIIAIAPFFLERFELLESAGIFLFLRLFRIFKFVHILEFEQSVFCNTSPRTTKNLKLLDGEIVQCAVPQHPIFLFMDLLIPIILISIGFLGLVGFGVGISIPILSIIVFIVAAIFFLKAWLDFNYDILYITNYRLLMQDYQIFGALTNALRYESITNIVPDTRGFFPWLFKMGKIEIETASESKTLLVKNIREPESVAQRIEANRQRIAENGSGLPHH